MKKFPIFQSILVILLVVVVAFGFFMSKKKPSVNKSQIEVTQSGTVFETSESLYEAEQKQLQEKMDNYSAYNSAVDALDTTACEKITGNDKLKMECSDNVYSAMASKEKNASFCEKIQNTTIKSRCSNDFVYDAAISQGQQDSCDAIKGDDELKSACVKNVVFAKIENRSFSGTTDVCTTLIGADKDYCVNRISKDADIDLLQKGTSTKDINICAQIKDANMKNTCSDTVYMTLALEKKDSALCARISDTVRKTNCMTQFARVNDANILTQAIAGDNLAMCATITTSDLRTKCNDNILLKTWVANKDSATCTKISDMGTRKQCSDAVKLILEQISKQK